VGTRDSRVHAETVVAGPSAHARTTARESSLGHRIAGVAGLPRTLCCPQQFVSYRHRPCGASVPRGRRSNPVRSVRPEPGRGRNRFRRLCQKAAGCAHKTPIGRSCLPPGAGARKAEPSGANPLRDRLIPETVALRDLSIPETHASSRDCFARARMTVFVIRTTELFFGLLRTRGDGDYQGDYSGPWEHLLTPAAPHPRG
jgi:hypothetical protein